MIEAGLLADLDVDDVQAAIAEVFDRWRISRDAEGWHAVRRGNFRDVRNDAESAVHSVHHADGLMLILMLHHQDQIAPPDGWDAEHPAGKPRLLVAGAGHD